MSTISLSPKTLSDQRLEEVRSNLVAIVMRSFELRPMPSGRITEGETQRRLDLTIEIWNHCRDQLQWSQLRIFDHLLAYVLQCIDGARLNAVVSDDKPIRDGSTMWAPEAIKKNNCQPERRLSALSVAGKEN